MCSYLQAAYLHHNNSTAASRYTFIKNRLCCGLFLEQIAVFLMQLCREKTCLFIYIYKKTNPDSCIAEKWKLCGETVRKTNIKTSLCAQTQQVNDNKHFYKSAVKIQVHQIHYS